MKTTDQARLEIAQGSRILAGERILDAYGHVSRRHPDRPDRFLIPRNMAPALVMPADVVELDLDGVAVSQKDAKLFLERFIHAEIYRKRPEVQAVVHSHAPGVLPFAAVPSVPVRVVSHMCGFLQGMPSPFDLADHAGPVSDLLIRSGDEGHALAEHLGGASVVLMRGHGYTAVGSGVSEAVFRAIYTSLNCEVQRHAMQLGQPRYLSEGEAQSANASVTPESGRAWDLWCHEHAPNGSLNA